MASKLGRVPSAAWKAVGSHRNGVRVLCSPLMDEPIEIEKELLIQIVDLLRENYLSFNGPFWSSTKGWYVSHNGTNPDYVHEVVWVSVDLEEYQEITYNERRNGKTSSMDFKLFEEDCFERLIKVLQADLNASVPSGSGRTPAKRVDEGSTPSGCSNATVV